MSLRKSWLIAAAVPVLIGAAVLVVSSCTSSVTPPTDDPSDQGLFDGAIDVSLGELLDKPRLELAEMADEWTTRIRLQEKASRECVNLVPALSVPQVIPVWREARFNPRTGISLPPYLTPGAKDDDVALLLARYGDVETARRLADPGNTEVAKQIKTLAYERNYPVEWTRLVGLMLHSAQLRLATDDKDGAKELVALHCQLRKLLGPKATQGALGANLLARGRRMLGLAAEAWKVDRRNELADQVRAQLDAWGDGPAAAVAVTPGKPRAEVLRLLRSPGKGRAVVAQTPIRALDLLELPLPGDGIDALVVFFNADRLAEVLVLYRAHIDNDFPKPADLAYLLEEDGVPAKDGEPSPGLQQRFYRLDSLPCEVAVVPANNTVGAYVRFGDGVPKPESVALRRDFGAVNLQRSFEQCRVRFAPDQRGDTLQCQRPANLAQVANPLASIRPTSASLQRLPGQDLVASLTLRYDLGEEVIPLDRLVLPLWSALGPGHFQGAEDDQGGHLALTWEDAQTRYDLCSPYVSGQPLTFTVTDRYGPEAQAERAAQAAAQDTAERKARIEAGRPLTRLPNHLDLEQITLGMRHEAIWRFLPVGESIVKQNFTGGLSILFTGPTPQNAPYVARQMFIRFDAGDRVAELRVRYQEPGGPAGGNEWTRELLSSLRKQAGAPLAALSPWSTLWSDLPPRKPAPVLYTWQDDVTRMTCQVDVGSVEVTLLRCPVDHEAGTPLPPLAFLPLGPDDCTLGTQKSDLLRTWKITEPTMSDGALVLSPPEPGPYDAILVWFDDDRVTRIVARHRHGGKEVPKLSQMGQVAAEAAVHETRTLGWPRRHDFKVQDMLQSTAWHDDVTRVRLFWEESDNGPPRLYTEWKAWRQQKAARSPDRVTEPTDRSPPVAKPET